MINNDVMRSLRYMLKINSQKMVEICKLGGIDVPKEDMHNFLRNEDEAEYIECNDTVMAHFLDGLIYEKRGKDESRPALPIELPITNNIVLKKLRVAFQLREEDVIEIIKSTGLRFSSSELSAFARKKDHRNYRECGDQILRNFLKGLSARI